MVAWDNFLFGLRLRNYRKKAKITQSELAERTDISTRTVGKLETGETITWPGLITVMKLAKALGICTSTLINDQRIPLSEEEPVFEEFQKNFYAANQLKQRAVLEMAALILSDTVVAEEADNCIQLWDMV